jgi:hypothetical protein
MNTLNTAVFLKNSAVEIRSGFSRIDLLAVVAALAVLGALSLSGSSTTKTTVQAIQCLENGHQLVRAWTQYAACNGGWLAPNQDDGALGNWLGGDMASPGAYNDPTNYGELNNTFSAPGYNKSFSALGNYVSNYRYCHCPADTSLGSLGGLAGPAAKLPRARSYSMNGAVGTEDSAPKSPVNGPWLTGSYGQNTAARGPYLVFGTLSSFVNPGPAQTFVILDEDPYSINDGCLSSSMNLPARWIDYPASFHNRACEISFADGHTDLHQWKIQPVIRGQLITQPGSVQDIEWLQTVTTAAANGRPIPAEGGPNQE